MSECIGLQVTGYRFQVEFVSLAKARTRHQSSVVSHQSSVISNQSSIMFAITIAAAVGEFTVGFVVALDVLGIVAGGSNGILDSIWLDL